MCGVAYSVLRGRVADTEEWTGTFVVALHSHAAPAERTPIEQSPVTRTAHMVVSLAVYPDAGVSFMGMPARIDATEDAQLVAWESWADSPLRGEVAPAERLEPDDVRGSVDAAVFARVAGAVSDLPAVATYLGF
jgi:hypothetical protein